MDYIFRPSSKGQKRGWVGKPSQSETQKLRKQIISGKEENPI